MPSSIYPSSCLLPQLLLVLRIYWVNINSIIFFTLYVPHQTNYSLITYTTNWKIQAIWRWMKKMHTQASPRSEHQNLTDDLRALFSKSIPVIVSTNIFLAHGVYDEVQSSKFECLLTPPVFTSYNSSSFEITIQEPYFSTFMTPIAPPTPAVTEWLLLQTLPIAKATVHKDENNICLYSPMVTKVPFFFGA